MFGKRRRLVVAICLAAFVLTNAFASVTASVRFQPRQVAERQGGEGDRASPGRCCCEACGHCEADDSFAVFSKEADAVGTTDAPDPQGCPCCPKDSSDPSCPCPGGCPYCCLAKVPCLNLFVPVSLPVVCLESCLVELPFLFSTNFHVRIDRPPRA